jgi:pimeloyl-ACP methyl ester carboxylesterase
MLKTAESRLRRIELGAPLEGEGPLWMSAEVFVPERIRAPATVLFCVPGGGMSRAYFDLGGGEPAARGFSFARAMTAQGFIVVALDYLGVGDSSRPADGFAITADLLSRCNQLAVAQISQALREGGLDSALAPCPDLVSVGVGHSMGAMLTILQQDAWRPHAALVLLGFTTGGLPQYITPDERAALERPDWRSHVADLARVRFNGLAYVPSPLRDTDGSAAGAALRRAQDSILATPATHSMMPGNVGEEAARIDVPLFLGLGERDMAGPPHATPQNFPACYDLTLHIVPGAGHHPFVTPAAGRLFERIGGWLVQLAAASSTVHGVP